MNSTQESRPVSSTNSSALDNLSECTGENVVSSEDKQEVLVNQAENGKRRKRETGEPTPQQLKAQKHLIEVVDNLPDTALKAFSFTLFLRIILPFLELALQESMYRFFLGMISFYTHLTNKEVAEIAGCSPKMVSRGRTEVAQKRAPSLHRQRKKGAGRKSKMTESVKAEIKRYVELRSYGPCTQGTQQYTVATIEGCRLMLERKGYHLSSGTIHRHFVSASIRCHMNKKLLYGNQKTETDAQKAIRHAQFDFIFATLDDVQNSNKIMLSIDTKKKENLGHNACRKGAYTIPGKETLAGDHDFYRSLTIETLAGEEDLLQREEGKAIPFGIYDIEKNKGYMNIGISSDTPEFVRHSIYRFFEEIRKDHPLAKELVLLCDGGGSNSSRCAAFRYQMAILSKQIGMKITIIHYPPYRSKFNKIERHVFAYVSKKFERAQLVNLQCVLDLIRSTTTKNGLTMSAELDTGIYQPGQKPTEEQMMLFSCNYIGPTKNSKGSKLSYTIDGTMIKDSDIPENRITVFEYKESIDLAKEEKKKLKEEKHRAKEKTEKKAKHSEQKQQTPETSSLERKKRGRKPKSLSSSESNKQDVA